MLFKEMVIKNKLEPPTSRKFSLDKWNNAYKELETTSKWDTSVYEAGLFFHGLFKFLREELGTLHANVPRDLTNDKLILLLCAYANEQQNTVIRKILEASQILKNNKLKIESDIGGTSLNIQEARQASIDSIEKALESCFSRINRSENLKVSQNTEMDSLHFMRCEYIISQVYAVYESYWKAVLYSDFIFQTKGTEHYIIQIPTDNEVAIQYNQVRQEKLARQEYMYIAQNFTEQKYPDRLRIIYKGKNDIKVKKLNNAPHEMKALYSMLTNEFMNIFFEFTDDFLQKTVDGISLQNIFDVFLQLVVYVHGQNKVEEKISTKLMNEKYLMSFFPKINLVRLVTALSKSLDIKYEVVSKIIDFLSYNLRKDLWGHPVVKIDDNNVGLLKGQLESPHIVRLIEAWSSVLKIDISEKGFHFEDTVRNQVNSFLEKNIFIKDYDKAISKTINLSTDTTITDRSEEIDLLMRVGNKIILADMKSIIISDSTISHYNAIQSLEHGVDQVIRKTNYIKNDLKLTFQKLGWTFDQNINYEIIPCVINSKGLYAGFSVKDIPIIDLKIFTHYFKSSKVPLITGEDMKDQAWTELYNNSETLTENFQKYLLEPPQITINREKPVIARPIFEMDFGNDVVNIMNFEINEYEIAELLITKRAFPVKSNCDIKELIELLGKNNTIVL